jgi:hypothetical protein
MVHASSCKAPVLDCTCASFIRLVHVSRAELARELRKNAARVAAIKSALD